MDVGLRKDYRIEIVFAVFHEQESLTFSGVVSPIPGQPQFMVTGHSPQFIQGGGSDQTTA